MSYFVDTNVIVYWRDSTEPAKQELAYRWLEYLWREHEGRLSFQVLQEYYSAVTTKLPVPLTRDEAREDVMAFMAWNPFPTDTHIMNTAWQIQDRYGFSWWDSLIVAAAQLSNCNVLLTEDLQHGQVLDGLRITDPFKENPDTALTT